MWSSYTEVDTRSRGAVRLISVSAHSAAISSKRATSDGSPQSAPTLVKEAGVLFLLSDLLAQEGEFVAFGQGQGRLHLSGGLGAAAFVGDP
ncbi:hypothetical protein HJ581_0001610 (plasmid) [Rhodococcus opacus]|nr:hypothetical protein HJ581_0001610 [Rhodococcus opacus]